jgi:hypothetical protein
MIGGAGTASGGRRDPGHEGGTRRCLAFHQRATAASEKIPMPAPSKRNIRIRDRRGSRRGYPGVECHGMCVTVTTDFPSLFNRQIYIAACVRMLRDKRRKILSLDPEIQQRSPVRELLFFGTASQEDCWRFRGCLIRHNPTRPTTAPAKAS